MLAEINQAKTFLTTKFGEVEKVLSGTYAVPTETSKGSAYMKVKIAEDMGMSDFSLWMDEAFTEDWYSAPEPAVQL